MNDRGTYQPSVRLRSAAVSCRLQIDALVRFSPADRLPRKPLAGGRGSVVSAAEVVGVCTVERVRSGEEPLR